jgi:hypothetical protein
MAARANERSTVVLEPQYRRGVDRQQLGHPREQLGKHLLQREVGERRIGDALQGAQPLLR